MRCLKKMNQAFDQSDFIEDFQTTLRKRSNKAKGKFQVFRKCYSELIPCVKIEIPQDNVV